MAIGIERFASLIEEVTVKNKIISFVTVTSNLEPKTYKIAHQLRTINRDVVLDTHLDSASLKAKLRRANKNNADYAIIIGEEELSSNTAIIKPLKDELKDQQTVSIDELLSFYKAI